jgi:hypothetical protein
VNRPGSFSIAAAAAGFVAAVCGVARAEVAAADNRFFLRVAPGAAYLHESWNPSGGAPGAVFSGGGASLEVSIGKSVRPRLVVGGLWQLVDVPDPNESYLGTTYVTPQTFRVFEVLAAFVDYAPNPRRGLHVGGSVGLLAASNLERDCCLSTHWGAALSVRFGYDVFFSRRWSVGAFAQLEAYRTSSTEANVSSVSNGLLPTLALALTFDWAAGRSSRVVQSAELPRSTPPLPPAP